MSAKKKSRGPGGGILLLARALLGVALAAAAYLAYVALSGGAVAGCGPDSGCDKVLSSRWAYWFGVPVSVPALLAYATLLGATFRVGGQATPEQQRGTWQWITGLAVLVAGAALWFIGLQALVLRSFCPFCLTAHLSGFVAAGLLLSAVPVERHAQRGRPGEVPRRAWGRFALAGFAGLVGLFAGQTLVDKPRNVVKIFAGKSTTNAPALNLTYAPPKIPSLTLHNGRFQLPLTEVPVSGPANAPHVMLSLFDYTCHHCREMHELLAQARTRFSNQLAIVSLPMPLDSNCNATIKRTQSAHLNACEYAKLGLAVWRANRAQHAHFDDWLFQPATPVPLAQARDYAGQLVGKENLARALGDEWVGRQLQTGIAIYQANSQQMKDGQMPQLVMGNAISLGPLKSVEPLVKLLEENLGLSAKPAARNPKPE